MARRLGCLRSENFMSARHQAIGVLFSTLVSVLSASCADVLGFEDGKPYPPDTGVDTDADASTEVGTASVGADGSPLVNGDGAQSGDGDAGGACANVCDGVCADFGSVR